MISVYATFKDEAEARRIARRLAETRLIACANIFPVKSIFRWKGEVAEKSEFAMLAKAAKRNFERIKEEIKSMHSYEVPCIVSLFVGEKDEGFQKWVEEESG